MYKYILETVDKVNWLGILPLLIFFIFFSAMIIQTIRSDKKYIKKMENLPLDND